ncbi:MAG TPA: PIG-L family deacetylase [Bacteroidia bacterium]|nr:PIG-L family deacetylase [Bacteroidia bacterium]
MKRLLNCIFYLLLISPVAAQYQPQPNSAEIYQKLKKLNTVGSVLYIAAHPDDENTRLLGYMANEMNLRTGYLSLTRGDGGQNLIGKEQSELLGLIRTQELLAARRTDGAEQFFTRANDFGYSKNPEETFGFWNKDSILADMVWVIRNFKPDIIITRFPTDGRGGHGHHTASAILALEAYDAAADPNRFPEQLAYTEVWQPKRVYWNQYNFNNVVPDSVSIKIDVGAFNPLLGKSYGEIAAESRSMHKSQGFGSSRQRGELFEYFQLLKGDSVPNIFFGINHKWSRLPGTNKIQKAIDNLLKTYSIEAPENITDGLVNVYNEIKKLDDKNFEIKYWKKQKLQEIEDLLVYSANLWLEASASDYMAIPGKDIIINTYISNRSNISLSIHKISYFGVFDTSVSISYRGKILEKDRKLLPAKLHTFTHTEKLPSTLPFSTPYWLEASHTNGLYTVNNQLLRGKPQNDAALYVTFYVDFGGLELAVKRPVQYKYVDPVKGEVYRPLEILPPATVNIAEKSYIFKDSSVNTTMAKLYSLSAQKIRFIVKANTSNVKGKLLINAPGGWDVICTNPDFSIANKGDEQILEAWVRNGPASKSGVITASVMVDNQLYNQAIRRVEYDHIPYQFTLDEAEAKLVNMELIRPEVNIGYIPGAGDDVANSLRLVGYKVTELTDDLLATEDLSKYGTIITGIRAFNTNERLFVYHDKLMEYIKNGGNMIVQYNTNSRVGPFKGKIGPYDFTISRDRVTDENAAITMNNHPVLSYPNKITNADFEGWIQERGIYFATELDSNFKTPLTMHDPNQEPHPGSLIIAPYGKGNFVYTGLAFFRELPEGVPGAYRLFVNLISLPKNQ